MWLGSDMWSILFLVTPLVGILVLLIVGSRRQKEVSIEQEDRIMEIKQTALKEKRPTLQVVWDSEVVEAKRTPVHKELFIKIAKSWGRSRDGPWAPWDTG